MGWGRHLLPPPPPCPSHFLPSLYDLQTGANPSEAWNRDVLVRLWRAPRLLSGRITASSWLMSLWGFLNIQEIITGWSRVHPQTLTQPKHYKLPRLYETGVHFVIHEFFIKSNSSCGLIGGVCSVTAFGDILSKVDVDFRDMIWCRMAAKHRSLSVLVNMSEFVQYLYLLICLEAYFFGNS